MSTSLRTLVVLSVLALPSVAFAAPKTFIELAALIVDILDYGTALLVITGIVVYFWGISTNILKMKDEGGQAFKAYFLWGIIALFIMFSIWGIIQLLQNTLFGNDFYNPNAGQLPDFGGPPTNFPQFTE